MSDTKTAHLVRKLTGFTGDAALYKLDPPLGLTEWDCDTNEERAGGSTEYVAVSAASAMFSGPETYIFPATEDGEVSDWGELAGSYKGGFSHSEALEGAGYAIV